jgi:hypothetical protein
MLLRNMQHIDIHGSCGKLSARSRGSRHIRSTSMRSLAQKNGSLHIHHFYIDKLEANRERLFSSDPELAQLLDNVAAVLLEHAVALAEDIADREDEES